VVAISDGNSLNNDRVSSGSPEERLSDGLDQAGAVMRVGGTVRRPGGPAAAQVRLFFAHLEQVGFDGAPRFHGFDDRNREILDYLDGAVAVPRYPDWAASEGLLVSVASNATSTLPPPASACPPASRGHLAEFRRELTVASSVTPTCAWKTSLSGKAKPSRSSTSISQRRPIRFSISLLRPAIGSLYRTRPTLRTHAVKRT
jgi:hypothetical protein